VALEKVGDHGPRRAPLARPLRTPLGVAHCADPTLNEQQVPIPLRREQRRQVVLGVVEELPQVALPVCGVGDDREALVEPIGD
jgi:hypothetical protein